MKIEPNPLKSRCISIGTFGNIRMILTMMITTRSNHCFEKSALNLEIFTFSKVKIYCHAFKVFLIDFPCPQ